jgi:hypothetical protein
VSTQNLLGGPSVPPPTLLPEDPDPRARLHAGDPPGEVAAAHPASSLAWAALAEHELSSGEAITAYAYARTGYHRGLDALRRNGWKGRGAIPWSHEPNQGFLRALAALARAAELIGEQDEVVRCRQLLADSDPEAAHTLGLGA